MRPPWMPWKWCGVKIAKKGIRNLHQTAVYGVQSGIMFSVTMGTVPTEKGKTMGESKLLELPYEKIAMSGGEMPKGLEYPDQILFLELRLLYDSYKKKMIDRDAATQEKAELLRTYEAHKSVDRMGKEWVDQIKRTELARAEYRKNKSIENADKLLYCVEGCKNDG